MTPTSEQIAEQLARKCADEVIKGMYSSSNFKEAHETILQSIPLVELVECAQASQFFHETMKQWPQGTICYADAFEMFHQSLTNLTIKLKRLGIDV